jgi:hypothetical protein
MKVLLQPYEKALCYERTDTIFSSSNPSASSQTRGLSAALGLAGDILGLQSLTMNRFGCLPLALQKAVSQTQ